jgi:hypothetical protein
MVPQAVPIVVVVYALVVASMPGAVTIVGPIAVVVAT